MELKKILSFLICPNCQKNKLSLKTKIICRHCQESYDVIDGIPVMISKKTLDKQEKKQQKIFNHHYSSFSSDYRLENWRLSMLERIFNHNFCHHVETYLDIGCGATGYTVIQAAKQLNCYSFGADISLKAIISAKKLADQMGLGQKTGFVVCSAENLPFKKNFFDYISLISVLEHLGNDQKAVAGIAKILKKAGFLFVVVPNAYRYIWFFLWPFYYYFDRQVGHQRHYSKENLSIIVERNNNFFLKKIFYNGHLIKFWQLVLEKINMINDKYWWYLEKKDISKNPSGAQLNAIFQKR